ncbi:hypothetical protein NAH09_11650, partial [Francisella tularensis subsp. holarctica]|nr:hypothetical protein [Francisella tularensis subsp. holarctica]
FPYIIHYQITYTQSQASDTSLIITLIPAIIKIPLLLLYTSYAYYIYRGKTKEKLSSEEYNFEESKEDRCLSSIFWFNTFL